MLVGVGCGVGVAAATRLLLMPAVWLMVGPVGVRGACVVAVTVVVISTAAMVGVRVRVAVGVSTDSSGRTSPIATVPVIIRSASAMAPLADLAPGPSITRVQPLKNIRLTSAHKTRSCVAGNLPLFEGAEPSLGCTFVCNCLIMSDLP